MAASKGNCYICGAELGKTAMKNHVLKEHNGPEDGQECCLLKIEGAYEKGYWHYVDIPIDRSLTVLDTFLRKIWLECCGHMSGFRGVDKSTKLRDLEPGYQFIHEYDYGDTTETLITVVGRSKRPPQKGIVRLLARNVPPQFKCAKCGAPAEFICTECQYDYDADPFFCAECGEKHEHTDMLLPVVNSPRMGVCGYCGELDTFGYVPPEPLPLKKGKNKKRSAKAQAYAELLYPEELYELAFKLKKAKLWEKLYEDEIFAVSLPDGETGYCAVMGMAGEHFALALYVGEMGLDSFRNIQRHAGFMDSGVSPLKAQEFMLSQRCLQCSFGNKDELSAKELASVRVYAARHGVKFRGANAFPCFEKFLPASFPQDIAAEDVGYLSLALRAALAVDEGLVENGWPGVKKEALGFSTGLACDRPYPLLTPDGDSFIWSTERFLPQAPPEYPRPRLRDDLLTERLKRAEKQNTSWVCDLVMLPAPIIDMENRTPYFAYALLIADKRTGTALPPAVVRDYEKDAEELLHDLGGKMLEDGVPRQLIVVDNRTYSFLENFADSTKIQLAQNLTDELLEDLEEDFMRTMDEDDYPEETADMVAALLRDADEDTLLSIPEPIWDSLRMALADADVPQELLTRFNELDKKRK